MPEVGAPSRASKPAESLLFKNGVNTWAFPTKWRKSQFTVIPLADRLSETAPIHD